MNVHAVDLTIVALYLVGMIAAGWWISARVKKFADFFVAGRALTAPVLICSIVSSYYGLDVLFGDAGDAAREGVSVYFTYMRPYTLAMLAAAFLIAGRFRDRNFMSLPDILAHYYGRASQVAGAVASFFYALPILAIMGMAAMGQVLFGLPPWAGALIGTGIAVLYTSMGGFWADTVTDTVQFTIMCVSLAVAVPFALSWAGGFDGIRATLGDGHFKPLGTAPPLYTLSYALTALSVLVEPAFYQRIFAARDARTVRRAFLWGMVLWAAYDWCVVTMGMCGAVLVPGTEADQMMLKVSLLVLPVGLSGLFLGGCLATAMSTIDSYLLIAAGNLVYDIGRRVPDDRAMIRRTRIAMVASGAVCIVMALLFDRIKEAWSFMATLLTCTVMVPILGALFLRRWATPAAGAGASVAGLAVSIAFYVTMAIAGRENAELETTQIVVGGATILQEYCIYFALPASGLGFLLFARRT